MGECMTCSKNGQRFKCITSVSVTDPRLKDVKDQDGKISGVEAKSWVLKRYRSRLAPIAATTWLQCSIFDKASAVDRVKKLRKETNQDIELISGEFGECAGMLKGVIQEWFSEYESSLINETLVYAERKGVGLGIGCDEFTGSINLVRQRSTAKAGGVRIGDKLISVDGVRLEDSREHAEAFKRSASKKEAFRFFLLKKWEGVYFKESIFEAFFGSCGSVANVVIERGGKRMTLKIKRGVG